MIPQLKFVGYNVIGQTCARALSLAICLFFFKVIETNVLGLVNVRLMLLYDTILFLTREPIRKANIGDSNIAQFVNTVWLSPIICFLISIVCMILWTIGGSTNSVALWVVLCFPLSSMIESLAEPFVVYSLRFSIGTHFAASQALLVVLKRILAFGFIVYPTNKFYPLDIFAFTQVLASSLYLCFNVLQFYRFSKQNLPELAEFESFRSFFPNTRDGLSIEICLQMKSEYPKILRQFCISNGSQIVMTFTNFLSLREIGVYDAVERIFSFFSRIFYAPLEDMCYSWSTKEKENLTRQMSTLLPAFVRISIYFGVVSCSFGLFLSKLSLISFELDTLTTESLLLTLFSFSIALSAVYSTMSHLEKLVEEDKRPNHDVILCVGHIVLNIILCYKFHAAGFILANSINMIVRICYSWHHISNYLGQSTPSIVQDILPKTDFFIFLFFSFFATMFSFVIFGTTQGLSHLLAHVAVGSVMLLLLGYHIYHTDHIVRKVINEKSE